MASPDPDFGNAINDFRKGGWIVVVLGMLGILARLLLAKNKPTIIEVVRKVTAGGITGVIAYFALHGTSIDPLYKSIICSTAGAFAPELFGMALDKIQRLFAKFSS
jgi:hypothetical protein